MKIIEDEEKLAHISYITHEGFKGLVYGLFLSTGLFIYLKTRHAAAFARYSTSIKTCVITMPTIALGAFYADQGSWDFDKRIHQGDFNKKRMLEEHQQWDKLSFSEKTIQALNNNKYPIIIVGWAASMYGSWVFVNRDKIMTTSQKAVQARMYAQAITIVLLLGTIVLASKEQELLKHQPAPLPEWKQILLEKEEEKKRLNEMAAKASSSEPSTAEKP